VSLPPDVGQGPLHPKPPPPPEPISSQRWRIRAAASLLFAMLALAVGGFGLVQLLSGGVVTILPNRPEVVGSDAIEAVVIYLGLGFGLLAWGIYAWRRMRNAPT
jgi:hypothetical protein